MATLKEYAIFSAFVYNNARGAGNTLPPLQGWAEIPGPSDMNPRDSKNGFTAMAFKKGDEIVIAFKGTDFLLGNNNPEFIRDWTANIGLASGAGSNQAHALVPIAGQIPPRLPCLKLPVVTGRKGASWRIRPVRQSGRF